MSHLAGRARTNQFSKYPDLKLLGDRFFVYKYSPHHCGFVDLACSRVLFGMFTAPHRNGADSTSEWLAKKNFDSRAQPRQRLSGHRLKIGHNRRNKGRPDNALQGID